MTCLADTRKLTIVFVRRGYSPSGGAENYLKRLGQGIVDLGHNAQLIAIDDWPTNEWPFGSIARLPATSAMGPVTPPAQRGPERVPALRTTEALREPRLRRANLRAHH